MSSRLDIASPGEDRMHAISFWQPVASLLAVGALKMDLPPGDELPFGSAIAVADLREPFSSGLWHPPLTSPEGRLYEWPDDRFVFVFGNVRVLPTPVPMLGRQQMFRPSIEETQAVRAQLAQLAEVDR